MSQRAQHPILLLSCLVLLLGAAVAAPAAGQGWSVDVLEASAVDANTTGAVVPAEDLPAAVGQPQNLGLYPMAGTPAPPVGSMAQRYVFVRNGQTLADWPAEARGRIALVKLANPTLPATPFALIANNAAAAGAVAVVFISAATNPTAGAGTIPAANIQPADGEILVDLIDGMTDAEDPPNGAISQFPIRVNPLFNTPPVPLPVPATTTSGAYHGTRVAAGTTPDFPSNPNTLAAYGGPALQTAIHPIGRGAAEPTLGINKQGTAFFAAAMFDGAVTTPAASLPRTLVMRSRDGGASWVSVSPELPEPLKSEPPVNGDPMVYVDEDTGRVFSLDTYDGGGMWLLFTDDEGESWGRNPLVVDPGVTDHQTIFSGPPTPDVAPLVDLLYGKVVYVCYNTVAVSPCLRSFDGGQTFTKAGFAFQGFEPDNTGPGPHEGVPGLCGGLTAHLRTDSAGRVFLPAGRCGLPGIAVSEDGAMSWQRVFANRDIPLPGTEHENTTAVDLADNLYMTWWDENDRLPYLTISRDHGLTWSAPLMIAPPGVQEVNFPTIDAGDPGRIVIHFPGTVVGDRGDSQRPWNLYEVVSTNALDADPLFVFAVANDPAQPVHRGNCGPGRCAGMFDFLDVEVPPAEAPAFAQGFWAAGVDTCDAACETYGGAASRMDGIVVRQTGGPPLRTPPLRVEDTDPAIEYQGGWHRKDAAAASGGTYHRRVGAKNGGGGGNPTARLVFAGDAVTYFYATASGGGSADVFIDGTLARTVSFEGATAEPAFGASATFDGLGEGSHEIVVAHRSGIATLDAFEIAPARGTAGADESAALSRSLTELRAGMLSGLPGGVTAATFTTDAATEELSVVVAGGAKPLLVRLLAPGGGLLATGGALLSGSALSGLDAKPALAGVYTVQVIDSLGGAKAVEISVAKTVRNP
jgi:PA domain